jgi:hypothetical protein
MSQRNGTLFGAVLTSLLMVGVASAGPLPTDPNALPLWQGSETFIGGNVSATKTLHAKVEYAVYAPGTFGTSVDLDTPVDPSGGTHYVYAYEVFHLVTGDATTVANLSVDLVTGAVPNSSTWIGHDAALPEGGVIPTSSNLINGGDGYKDNAKWNFIAPALGSGGHSRVLYFTSQYEPHWRVSSMQGALTTLASDWLPSPIPEPTTYTLAVIGVLSLVSARYFRRRRS